MRMVASDAIEGGTTSERPAKSSNRLLTVKGQIRSAQHDILLARLVSDAAAKPGQLVELTKATIRPRP
jgi:hypothetical protein